MTPDKVREMLADHYTDVAELADVRQEAWAWEQTAKTIERELADWQRHGVKLDVDVEALRENVVISDLIGSDPWTEVMLVLARQVLAALDREGCVLCGCERGDHYECDAVCSA